MSGGGEQKMMRVRGRSGRFNRGDLWWEMPKVFRHSGSGQDMDGTCRYKGFTTILVGRQLYRDGKGSLCLSGFGDVIKTGMR